MQVELPTEVHMVYGDTEYRGGNSTIVARWAGLVTTILCREGDQATVQCVVEGGKPTPKVLSIHVTK